MFDVFEDFRTWALQCLSVGPLLGGRDEPEILSY
jgi:hypothetical protein